MEKLNSISELIKSLEDNPDVTIEKRTGNESFKR